MNLSAIKALCAGGKHATIYNAMWGGGQWISNGFGAWPVEGIRLEDEEALMELWNLSDKARSKAVIMTEIASDRRFTQRHFEGEEELKELGATAFGDDSIYIALQSHRGVLLWIDAQLLRPLRGDYRQYFARWEYGRPLVAVYEDLTVCKALILPTGNQVADTLRRSAKLMGETPFHWRDAEDEAAEAEQEAEAKLAETDESDDGEVRT